MKDASTIAVYEAMARFHVLAFDELRDESSDNFDPIQNMEKLSQTLTSLRHLYRDNMLSSQPFPTPNQAEMHSYLLFNILIRTFMHHIKLQIIQYVILILYVL